MAGVRTYCFVRSRSACIASRVVATAYPNHSTSGAMPIAIRTANATNTWRMDGSPSIQSLNVANMLASYPSRPGAGEATGEVYDDVLVPMVSVARYTHARSARSASSRVGSNETNPGVTSA